MAGSLLTAVGLTELITNSELEYEELIIRLASNPKELKKIKQKLNKNLTRILYLIQNYTHVI